MIQKTKRLVLLFTLLLFQFNYAQIPNFDAITNGQLLPVATGTGTRAGLNVAMAVKMGKLTARHKKLLIKKYKKNKYDKKGVFIAKSASSMALGLGTGILAQKYSNGYYMTKNKREYIKNIGLDKLMLFSLQVLDYKNISAAKRQEIYRLRREITKEYSNNDKRVMKLLLLSSILYAVEENDPNLIKLVKTHEYIN